MYISIGNIHNNVRHAHQNGVMLLGFLAIPKSESLSYPGNLTKSNSEDLRSSLVSTLELHSNESLCQESDIPLIH